MKYFVEARCIAPGHENQEGCYSWFRISEDYYETKQHAEGEIWASELETIFWSNDPEMDEYRIVAVGEEPIK